MANDPCAFVSDADVARLVKAWKDSDTVTTEQRHAVLGNNFGSGWSEKAEKDAAAYFRAVIERYCKDDNNEIKVPELEEMEQLINRYADEVRNETNAQNSSAKGKLVFVGASSADKSEVTGILDKELEISDKGDYNGSDRQRLASVIEDAVKQMAKEAGFIESVDAWDSEEAKKNKKLTGFRTIIHRFRSGNIKANMDDLYMIAVLAGSVYVKRDKQGNVVESGPYIKDKDVILKALAGDAVQLNNIRGMYRNFGGGTRPSRYELRVMDALLSIYAANNSDFSSAIQEIDKKNIRAANGSSRQHKALAASLRSFSPVQNTTTIEEYALGIKPALTTDVNMQVAAMIRPSIAHLGQDVLDSITTLLQERMEGKQNYGDDIDDLVSKIDGIVREAQRSAGEEASGLDKSTAQDILSLLYGIVLNDAATGEAQSLITVLASSGTGELEIATSTFRFGEQLKNVLMSIRDGLRVDDAATEHPDISADTESLSESNQVILAITSENCAAVFDTPTLRTRVNALAHTILQQAIESRGELLITNKEQLSEAEAEVKRLTERRKELADKTELTEEEEAEQKTIGKNLLKQLRKRAKLRKQRAMLLNNRTKYSECLRLTLNESVEGALGTMTVGEYSVDPAEKLKAEQIKALAGDLKARAFAQIEALTGISIIYDRKDNTWKVEEEKPTTENRNEGEIDSENGDSADESDRKPNDDSLDFRDDIDPWGHLSQNVRVGFAMIPVCDSKGKPVLDDIGCVQYYDPKALYFSVMAMHDGLVVDADDFYTIEENSSLDNTDKDYPGMYEEDGYWKDNERTAKEAFPKGKPTFHILKENEGRYPWVKQLRERLEEDFMEVFPDEADRNEIAYGQLATDLYVQMGFSFTKRAVFRSNSRGYANPFHVVNQITEVESVRRVQNRNFNQRVIAGEAGMIWNNDGTINRTVCETLRNELKKLFSAESMVSKTTKDQESFVGTIHKALTAMGYEIDKNLLMNEFENPNNEGLGRLNKILEAAKLTLTELTNDDEKKYGVYSARNIYTQLEGVWQHMHSSVGFFCDTNEVQSTQNINGKAQQNFVAESALSRTMMILTYGWKQMLYATDEKRAELLKKRQEKIRNLYGVTFDQMMMNNPTLRALYEGKDVEYDFEKTQTGLRVYGDTVLINAKDDLEFSNLTEADQLEMQLGAFLRAAQSEATQRSALYRFPVPADSPVMTFTSGKVQTKEECIAELSDKALGEALRIAHNTEVRRHYVRIWAIERGRVPEEGDENYGKYYDVLDKRMQDIPGTDKWMWERDKLIHKHLTAKSQKERDDARTELEKLAEQSTNNPNGVNAWSADQAIEEYKKWRYWCPRESFFTSEMRYGKLPNLEFIRMPVQDVLSTIEEWFANREGEEKARRLIDELGRALSSRDGRKMTLNGLLKEACNILMPDEATFEDALRNVVDPYWNYETGYDVELQIIQRIAYMYTQQAMGDLFDDMMYKVSEIDYDLLNMHRVASIFFNGDIENPGTDINGISWKVVQDTSSSSGFSLQDVSSDEKHYLTKEQLNFYSLKIQELRGDFGNGKLGFAIGKDGKKYSIDQVERCRMPLKNQSAINKIIKDTAKISPDSVDRTGMGMDEYSLDLIELMFLNTFRHNTDMLEMMMVDPSMFFDQAELTKRLKGLTANGTRLDKNRLTNHKTEYFIITADDKNSISTDYLNKVIAYKRAISEGRATVDSAKAALWAYSHQNATDAQGYITRKGMRRKASMAGSANYDVQKDVIMQDMEKGIRHIGADYDSMSDIPALKQVGMGPTTDTDPTGDSVMYMQYVKNSEGMLMQTVDGSFKAPRSARLTALEQFMQDPDLVDDNGNKIEITTAQKPSGVKTSKKGIVDTRYIPSRVQWLRDLAEGKEVPTTVRGIDVSAHIKDWKLFLEAILKTTGWNAQDLTFDAIDGFLHNGNASINNTKHVGIEQWTDVLLNAGKDSVEEEEAKQKIEMLTALRDFMLPTQVSGQGGAEDIKELRNHIRNSVRKEGNKMNDQFIYQIDPAYQHIQVRQSNHLVDSEAHLGSQISYIAAEAIDFNAKYEMSVNGEEKTVEGRKVYNRLYECLAARLVHGLNEYNEILTGKGNEVTLDNLQHHLLRLTMNNPKFKTSDIWYALRVIKDAQTGDRFATPLASVAIIYKISDVLTSIVRNKTHRNGMKGSGNVVIEADELYEDQLTVRRKNGKIVGVECFLPAWAKEILQHCLVEKEIEVEIDGVVTTITEQTLDIEKLKGTGLETIVGYRIPTEDVHSTLPLIVKGFLPQEKGNTIVVSKDIITMSGSDNDIDKLFLMLRHIDKEALKEGKLQPVQYHWNPNNEGGVPDVKAVSQSDEQIENMIIDIMYGILTSPQNEARLMSPQNPNMFEGVSLEIAYINLPKDKKLRKHTHRRNRRTGQLESVKERWVFNQDDPDWDDQECYQRESPRGESPSPDEMKDQVERMRCLPVQAVGSMMAFHKQHTLAKTGIGIMANRMATHFKVRTGLKALGRNINPIEIVGDKNGAVVIDGRRVFYGAGKDMDGNDTTENVANTGGAIVDSGKNFIMSDLGITLNNLSFFGFLQSCGLSRTQVAYIIALMNKYPDMRRQYYVERKKLVGEGKKYKDDQNFSSFTTNDLKFALKLDNLMNANTWEAFSSSNLINVIHGIVRLQDVYRQARPWESTFNANSAKNGLSNDVASAVWAEMQIDRVVEKVTSEKFPLKVPPEMVIRNGMSESQIANGEYVDAAGNKHIMAMWLPQMYHTMGVEKGLDAMKGLMFHARPEFKAIVKVFEPVWSKMSKEKGIKFIRRLHDHFSTFFLSAMDMVNSQRDADGKVIRGSFVEMRNYYCYRFPAEFAGMDPALRTKLNVEYKFLKALKFEEGKLILDDSLKEGFNAEDIRQSLNRMAASNDPATKKLARSLFLYSYFTDGLRFSYGALSNAFTAGFLSSDLFEEYNEKIGSLVNSVLSPKMLGTFCLQFIANNAVSLEIGTFFRATAAYERTPEGTVQAVSEEKQDPAKDELTPQEINRLESWLESKESDRRLYLDQTTPLQRMGAENVDVPSSLLLRLKAIHGEKANGYFFRVQASYGPRTQNVYFVANDNGRPYIIKVKDFINDVWYKDDMDLSQMGYYNCVRTLTGNIGAFDKFLIGRLREANDERNLFRLNQPNPYFEKFKGKGKKSDSGLLNAQSEFEEAGWADEWADVDNQQDSTDEWGEMPEGEDEWGGRSPNLGMQDAPVQKIELREEERPYDKTSYVTVTDIKTQLFPDMPEDQTDDFGISFMISPRSREDTEERMQQVLEEHDAAGEFNNRNDAFEKANEINSSQDEFIATVADDGTVYSVAMHNAGDTAAAEEWRNQYGKAVMEGTEGINSIMDSIGDQSQPFIAIDESTTLDQYNDIIDNTIKVMQAFEQRTAMPQMHRAVAEAFVRKLMREDARLLSEFRKAIMDAINGDQAAIDMLGKYISEEVITNKDDVRTWIGAGENPVEDDIDDSFALMLLSRMMENSAEAEEYLNQKGKSWLANQLQLGIKRVRTSLGDRQNTRPDFTEQKNRLSQLKQNAQPNQRQPLVTPQEQMQADALRRQMESNAANVERLASIMRKALIAEERKERILIQDGWSSQDSKSRIETLKRLIGDDGTAQPAGVVNYLAQLVKEYEQFTQFFFDLNNGSSRLTNAEKLGQLALCLTIIRSHTELLDNLGSLMSEPTFVQKMATGTNVSESMQEMFNSVKSLHEQMKTQLKKHAGNAFMDLVREFVGDVPIIKNADGSVMSWSELVNAVNDDISIIDQYCRSMGNTKDPVGQVFDLVVKKQKDRARTMAINDQQTDIKKLAASMLSKKLTNFEFMFERDENGKKTGYYLSQLKWGEFHRELKKAKDKLNKVLNDNNATQQQREQAQLEFNQWCTDNDVETNSVNLQVPKQTARWINPEYAKLERDHKDQFDFLQEFMDLKKEYDERLGQHTNHERAIQRRMTSEQRFRANFTLSPKALWENVSQAMASEYLVREDDYEEYGEHSTLLDFEGNERTVIPAPFVRMLKNPEELSTDPIGCLVAYSYTTANFMMMKEIANPMEVAFSALVNDKNQVATQGGRELVETFRSGNKEKAAVKRSRLLQKARDFLDAQLYMRYLDDGGDTFKFLGKEFRKSKLINAFLRMSAIAQLGFNWLVDLANLANGLLQTNIEVFGRKHFSGAQLLKADKIYLKELHKFLPDLANPIKESKLALVGQLFNIMQNFDIKVYDNRRFDLLSKLFNTSFAFMGTSGGNHWLYYRTAIAMMLNTEVEFQDGTKANLWDALKVVDNEEGGKKLVFIKDGPKINGEDVSISSNFMHTFGRKIADVNQGIIGIYNKDDMMMAQRISWARLFIAFRKHIIPLMDKRWRGTHINELTGEEVNGYMRTFGELLQGLRNAQFNVPAAWNELSEEQKADVRMALMDIGQFLGLLMLSLLPFFGDDDDDDEEGRLEKICQFLVAREKHELGSMLPTIYAPKEVVNMANQPTIGTPQIADITNFATTVFTPWTWTDRVKSGPFAGQTELEMRIRKLPIAPLAYYRNIDKSLNGINNSTWFYNRGYVEGGGKI